MFFDELMEIVPVKSKDYVILAKKMDQMKENFMMDKKTYITLTNQLYNLN